jgi:stress-induced morphogen
VFYSETMALGEATRSLVRRSRYLYDILEPINARAVEARWQRQGRPIPASSSVKRNILRRIGQEHHLRVLVETGTFQGDTVMALRREFDRIVSVELSPELHAKAVRRARHERNVELLLGDSASVLPRILATLHEPALFWLDAHYSGTGTALGGLVSPISAELSAVLGHPVRGHVVLIDDAREFHDSARSGYPGPEVIVGAARQYGYLTSEKHDIFFLMPE